MTRESKSLASLGTTYKGALSLRSGRHKLEWYESGRNGLGSVSLITTTRYDPQDST